MIEHLFMLRCLLHPDLPVEDMWVNAQVIRRNGTSLSHIWAVTHWLMNQLPSEAASLKNTPDVIQCDQCKGIFPMEFMHYLAWLEVDYCDGCLFVYYCDIWNMTTQHALLAVAAQHFLI